MSSPRAWVSVIFVIGLFYIMSLPVHLSSRKAINRASERLLSEGITDLERLDFMNVLSQWRALHANPLQSFQEKF